MKLARLCVLVAAVLSTGLIPGVAGAADITPTGDEATLLQALVVPNTGLTIDASAYAGHVTASGTAANGPLGIADGIIMTTGKATIEQADLGGGFVVASWQNNAGTHPWCQAMTTPAQSWDTAMFTIVFTTGPQTNFIEFSFIFGSEEYPDYVGQQFNDSFGAFLNGTDADPISAQIAFDKTGAPININSGFFGGAFVKQPAETGIDYNGTTPVLKTVWPVQPGTTNTLTFMVCDAFDAGFDSGVFISGLRGLGEGEQGTDATESSCTNGTDEDGDNLVDCADDDCAGTADCAAFMAVTAIDPNLTEAGSLVDVTISGDYFFEGVTLAINGADVSDLTYISSTELTATLTVEADAPLGCHDVTVSGAGESAVLVKAFCVSAPGADVGSTFAVSADGGPVTVVTIKQDGTKVLDTWSVNNNQPAKDKNMTMRFHRDPDNKSWIVIVNDKNSDGSGGKVTLSIDGQPGMSWLACDDGNECTDFAPDGTVTNSWSWGSCCTDGGIFGPVATTECTLMDAPSFTGLDIWRFVDKDWAVVVEYPMTAKVKMCPSFGGDIPPKITSVAPGYGLWGETFDLVIDGSGFDVDTTVSFAPGLGVVIDNLEIASSKKIIVTVSIAVGAPIGLSDIIVSTGSGQAISKEGFSVLDVLDTDKDGVADNLDCAPTNPDVGLCPGPKTCQSEVCDFPYVDGGPVDGIWIKGLTVSFDGAQLTLTGAWQWGGSLAGCSLALTGYAQGFDAVVLDAQDGVLDEADGSFTVTLDAAAGEFAFQLGLVCPILSADPTVFLGQALAGGGAKVYANGSWPWVTASNPTAGEPGTIVTLSGGGFGATPGVVSVCGVEVSPKQWGENAIIVEVPNAGSCSGGVVVSNVDGWTSGVAVFKLLGPEDEPPPVVVPKQPYPHTVDGVFTDWDALNPPDDWEWKGASPASGKYTWAYFDYDGTKLHILNDWRYNDTTVLDPDCFNLFKAWTGGGKEVWLLKVFGDGTTEVSLNGEPYDLAGVEVTGEAKFTVSPLLPDTEHTIFELSFPAQPGGFGVQLHDPGPSFGCKTLVTEPASFQGNLGDGGGLVVTPSKKPTIYGFSPAGGAGVGVEITIEGIKLGAAGGSVSFGGVVADIVSWSDSKIVVTLSTPAGNGAVTVTTQFGAVTNALWFNVYDDGPDGDLDGDGFKNETDVFPWDKTEWADADCDGAGDNSDPKPNDPTCAGSLKELCNGKDDDCDGLIDDIQGDAPCLFGCNPQSHTCIQCGNGILDPGEGCDDFNTDPGDSCSPTCFPTGSGTNQDVLVVAYINSGGYQKWGAELGNRVAEAGGNVTYYLNPPDGTVAGELAGGTYKQLWFYDLDSTGATWPTDAKAVSDYHKAMPVKNAILDGRITGDLWHPPASKKLIENYYVNLKERGGGAVYMTDHNAFCNYQFNNIMAQIGYNACTGNFGGNLPFDADNLLMSYPNTITSLYNDSSTGAVPYNVQPNGEVLYSLAYYGGNVNTPAITTTIKGSIGFQVAIQSPQPLIEIFPGDELSFEAQPINGSEPINYSWSSDLDGVLGSANPLLATLSVPGEHLVEVFAQDSAGISAKAVITVTVLDPDLDGDGFDGWADNCPFATNADQLDTDADTLGDVCDFDDDGDGFCDSIDPTPVTEGWDFDKDGVTEEAGDCDDKHPDIYPGAPEICDGLDNNCAPDPADSGPEADASCPGPKVCDGGACDFPWVIGGPVDGLLAKGVTVAFDGSAITVSGAWSGLVGGGCTLALSGYTQGSDAQVLAPLADALEGDNFEFTLPADVGEFAFQLTLLCPDVSADPTVFLGHALQGGGAKVYATIEWPWVTGFNPIAGEPGTIITIVGGGFGKVAGSIAFCGATIEAKVWSDTKIVIEIPLLVGCSQGVVIHNAAGWPSGVAKFTVLGPEDEPPPVIVPKQAYPHTVDGVFTDWTAIEPPPNWEWKGVSVASGKYTYAYFNYDGTKLHLLNDWKFNDFAQLDPDCFNLFKAWTGGGSEVWILKVYGDGEVEVTLNGLPYPLDAEEVDGAADFKVSPLLPDTPHSIFELSLPASPGGFGVQLHDPGPSFACDVLFTEPASFQGVLGAGGGLVVTPSKKPTIYGFSPFVALLPGEEVHIDGIKLGDAQGSVSFGGVDAEIVSWTGDSVIVLIPDVLGSVPVFVTTVAGVQTNTLWYSVACPCPGEMICVDGGCAFPFIDNPKSKYPHTIDGAFTDWDAANPPAEFEWYDIKPALGKYTAAYFDFDGDALYILNDWHHSPDGAIDDGCYNQFKAYTGGGAEQWTVRVYGNGDVEVFKNGFPVDLSEVEGAAGFGVSPSHPDEEHTIYELKLPASPGGFGVQLHDPGPTFGCPKLVTDPTVFVGVAVAGGGSKIFGNQKTTWIVGATPDIAAPGSMCWVDGVGFGGGVGSVTVCGVQAEIKAWSDGGVLFVIPEVEVGCAGGVVIKTLGGVVSNGFSAKLVAKGGQPGWILSPWFGGGLVVDGSFGGWSPGGVWGPGAEWWGVVPVSGKHGAVFVDYNGTHLSLIAPWIGGVLNGLGAGQFIKVKLFAGGGMHGCTVHLFGDGSVKVFIKGQPWAALVTGGWSFGKSVLWPGVDQLIFELGIPLPIGGFGFQIWMPDGAGGWIIEPTNYQGNLLSGGGVSIIGSTLGTIYGFDIWGGKAGTLVKIQGGAFGLVQGGAVVKFGDIEAEIVAWGPGEIICKVPIGAVSGFVVVDFGGWFSNKLWFDVPPGDLDGDGVPDEIDIFPLDPLEWADLDGDGVGDNSDCAPDNAICPGEGACGEDGSCDFPWTDGVAGGAIIDLVGVYSGGILKLTATWLDPPAGGVVNGCFAQFALSYNDGEIKEVLFPVEPNDDGTFEIEVEAAPGEFAVKVGVGCGPLIWEPSVFVGHCLGAGGIKLYANATVPWVSCFGPSKVWPGSYVVLYGGSFGVDAGTVTVCGQPALIVGWGNDEVVIGVPEVDVDCGGAVVVTTKSGAVTKGLVLDLVAFGAQPGKTVVGILGLDINIDGLFDLGEWWGTVPCTGHFGVLQAWWSGVKLTLGGAWIAGVVKVLAPEQYIQLKLVAGGGMQAFVIHIFGDGTSKAWLNGKLWTKPLFAGWSIGGSGFWPDIDNLIWECGLDVDPGEWGVQIWVPDGDGGLIVDGANFWGTLFPSGGLDLIASIKATIYGLSLYKGAPGDSFIIEGAGFGAAQGDVTVWLGNVQLSVTDWTDGAITVVLPEDGEPAFVTIDFGEGVVTNGLWFDFGGACPLDLVLIDGECELPLEDQPPSVIVHDASDGAATGWGVDVDYEWSDITALETLFGVVYVDFDGVTLYVYIDWHNVTITNLGPGAYILVSLYVPGSGDAWWLKLYADGAAKVYKNGVLIDLDGLVSGAAFAGSPNLDLDHYGYEFAMPWAAGRFALQAWGPKFGAKIGGALIADPTIIVADALDGGGCNVYANSAHVAIAGFNPGASVDGTICSVSGAGFGVESGVIILGEEPTNLVGWWPHRVLFPVPSGVPAGSGIAVLPAGVGDGKTTTAPALPDSADAGWVLNGFSGIVHVVDGEFTNWTGITLGGDYEWWDCTPITGVNAVVYIDYDGTTLWLMIDWAHLVQPDPDMTLVLHLNTGDGSEQWAIAVAWDGTVSVTLNGEVWDGAIEAAGTFGKSPVYPNANHTLYELSLPVSPGVVALQTIAPLGESAASVEPAVVFGALERAGGSACQPFYRPTLLWAEPYAVARGATLALHGAYLGGEQGDAVVTIDDVECEVVSWSEGVVEVIVPDDAVSGPARIAYAVEETNVVEVEVGDGEDTGDTGDTGDQPTDGDDTTDTGDQPTDGDETGDGTGDTEGDTDTDTTGDDGDGDATGPELPPEDEPGGCSCNTTTPRSIPWPAALFFSLLVLVGYRRLRHLPALPEKRN